MNIPAEHARERLTNVLEQSSIFRLRDKAQGDGAFGCFVVPDQHEIRLFKKRILLEYLYETCFQLPLRPAILLRNVLNAIGPQNACLTAATRQPHACDFIHRNAAVLSPTNTL